MTIMATHFAIVLGAWRLRVRIDLDEPPDERDSAAAYGAGTVAGPQAAQRDIVSWGRG